MYIETWPVLFFHKETLDETEVMKRQFIVARFVFCVNRLRNMTNFITEYITQQIIKLTTKQFLRQITYFLWIIVHTESMAKS